MFKHFDVHKLINVNINRKIEKGGGEICMTNFLKESHEDIGSLIKISN